VFAFGPKGVSIHSLAAVPTPRTGGLRPMQCEGFVREIGHAAPAHILLPRVVVPAPLDAGMTPMPPSHRKGFFSC